MISSGPNSITNDAILYLDAANPKSYPGTGTLWVDLTGNGNDGTLVNGPTHADTSFAFSPDLAQYVSFNPSILNGAMSGTVVVWFMRNAWFNTLYDTVFTKSNGGSWANNHIQIGRSGGGDILHTEIADNTSSTTTSVETPTINIGSWYGITMTWDGGVLICYTNGTEVDRSNTTIALPSNSTYFRLAQGAGGITNRYFSGNISMFMCYDRALSSSEVLQNYNLMRVRFNI